MSNRTGCCRMRELDGLPWSIFHCPISPRWDAFCSRAQYAHIYSVVSLLTKCLEFRPLDRDTIIEHCRNSVFITTVPFTRSSLINNQFVPLCSAVFRNTDTVTDSHGKDLLYEVMGPIQTPMTTRTSKIQLDCLISHNIDTKRIDKERVRCRAIERRC